MGSISSSAINTSARGASFAKPTAIRDLRHVEPLLGIGNTYRQERNPAGLGISSLQDALSILLEQPQRDAVAIATTLRDIGDWAVAFGKTGYEGTEYQRAWQLLESVPNGEELRREWFTGANYVLYEPISPRSLSMDPDAPSGYVTVRFDLDTAGGSQNVTLVESESRRAQGRSRAAPHSPLAFSAVARQRRDRARQRPRYSGHVPLFAGRRRHGR